MASPADIVVFGGSAYGGKSYALLLESVRHVGDPRYNGVIFRRTSPQITAGGGLWDTAGQIYPHLGGVPQVQRTTYSFPSGAYVKFSHLQHETNKFDHQGAQYSYIGFDELTHFTKSQFFYLLTRNRPPTGCKIRSYCRCTCNPDAESWVREFILWWIDESTGYPIPERNGVIRYFTRDGDDIVWVDKEWRDSKGNGPKSVTFIRSTIDDNPKGVEADPDYESTLLMQDSVTKERLLKGNWNITYKGGMFSPDWFKIVDAPPADMKLVRYWDRAATEVRKDGDDPDWTAGALVGLHQGELYIHDISRFQGTPHVNERRIKKCAHLDGHEVAIGLEQEPGSAGVDVISHYQTRVLRGFEVYKDRPTGNKVDRARPWCSLAQEGHVYLVRGPWNRAFLNEAGAFPRDDAKKDQVDAVSGAYKMLTGQQHVWPQYGARNHQPFEITWDKLEQGVFDIFCTMWWGRDGSVSAVWWFWGRKTRVLRAYAEIVDITPIPELLSSNLRAASRQDTVRGLKYYGNDDMFGRGQDLVKTLRRNKIRVQKPRNYQENASIAIARYMIDQRRIVVHPNCMDLDLQIRSWRIDGKRPEDGYPLCRGLCMALSELKEQGELKEPVELEGYSKKKQAIGERLRRGGPIKAKRSEWEYLSR